MVGNSFFSMWTTQEGENSTKFLHRFEKLTNLVFGTNKQPIYRAPFQNYISRKAFWGKVVALGNFPSDRGWIPENFR